MEVKMQDFCNKLIEVYDDLEYKYKRATEHLTNAMKRYNEHLFCGGVCYSCDHKAYQFNIGACYAALCVGASFQSANVYISRDKDGFLNCSNYDKSAYDYPDIDAMFQGCYDEFDRVYKCIEEFNELHRALSFTYDLGNYWYLMVKMNQYKLEFKVTQDTLCIRKHIVISKQNNWEPVFKQYQTKDIEKARSILAYLMEHSMIEAEELSPLFIKPPEPEKKRSWFQRLFS